MESMIETRTFVDDNAMTELLERAIALRALAQPIAQLKNLPDAQQDEVAKMIFKQIGGKDRLSSLWQKVEELGRDENEPTMAEITAMVKEVRQGQNRE